MYVFLADLSGLLAGVDAQYSTCLRQKLSEILELDTMSTTDLVRELSQIVATTIPKKHQKGIWATLYKKIHPSSSEEEEEEEEEVHMKVNLHCIYM